jgi:hypothetical protein
MLQDIEHEVNNIYQRARYKQKKIMRHGYSRKRAIADINGQLAGTIRLDDDNSSSAMEDDYNDLHPIPAKAIKALLAVPAE